MTHDDIAFIRLLQAKGLRVTTQRLQILDAVCEGKGHSLAGEILARARQANPAIDESTVYRTLNLFCKLGIAAANTTLDGGTIYELIGQPPHNHLVCIQCGCEYQIPDRVMRNLLDEIQKLYGFSVTTRHLILEGLCQVCLKTEGK